MKRVLLTGISGTGKSAAIVELVARGYNAVDLDSNEYSEWVDVEELENGNDDDEYGSPVESNRDWVWQEDRIQELLNKEDAGILFLSGCAANMGKFLPQFDHVVLFSAPKEVIAERLRTRTNNLYGKHPQETARVLDQIESVEPMLRKIAGHEIDTSASLDRVVSTVLQIARPNK